AAVDVEHDPAGAQLWLESAVWAVVFMTPNGLMSRTAEPINSSPPTSTSAAVTRRRERGSRPPIIPSSRSRYRSRGGSSATAYPRCSMEYHRSFVTDRRVHCNDSVTPHR